MRVKWCSVLFWCFLFRLFASQWWRTGCPRITGDASLQPHLKPFLWIISLSPSFDAIVETLKNEPVSTPCVFSCQVFSLIKTRVRVHLYTFRWGRVGPQLVLSLLASSKRSRSPKSSGKRATPVQNIHPSFFFHQEDGGAEADLDRNLARPDLREVWENAGLSKDRRGGGPPCKGEG